MSEASPVNDHDLSKDDGNTVNTANCYLVGAPGTYKLPLVYGNALKDGSPNNNAYISGNPKSETVLDTLINHLGKKITNCYIYENKDKNGTMLNVNEAVLVWQDAKNLVKNVGLSSDRKFLTFEVGQTNIKEGNAVVAVKDAAGSIMWSWHIWVTNYKLGQNLKIITVDGQKSFMPVNIGWCSNRTKYDKRNVKVRFVQIGSGKDTVITITQSGHIDSAGNSPYYQWGRKDPMTPSDGKGWPNMNNKKVYDINGVELAFSHTTKWGRGDTCIASSIKDPRTFCDTAFGNKHCNLWDVTCKASCSNSDTIRIRTSVKSVYDPSPAGYKVPFPAVFTYFTEGGNGVDYDGKEKIKGRWTGEGWLLKTEQPNDSIFFPASGIRFYQTATLQGINFLGHYVSSLSHSERSAWLMLFTDLDPVDMSFAPLKFDIKASGRSVRPIKEE